MFVRTSVASQLIQYALPSFLGDLPINPQPRAPADEANYDRALTFRATYPLLDLVVSQSGCRNSALSIAADVTIEDLAFAKSVRGMILQHAPSPITDVALRTMNGTLRGLGNPPSTPYRTALTWVGGHIPSLAALVPTPPASIPEYMADLVAFMRRDDVPETVSSALIYYQLLTVHPFKDGNGRLARVLTALRSYQRQASLSNGLIVAAGLNAIKDCIAACFESVFDGEAGDYLALWHELEIWAESVAEFSVRSLRQMHDTLRQRLASTSWGGAYASRIELTPILSRAELKSIIRGSDKLVERYIASLQDGQVLTRREK